MAGSEARDTMEALSVLAEKLPHVKQLHLYVPTTAGEPSFSLTRKAIHVRLPDGRAVELANRARLECDLLPETATTVRAADAVVLKVPMPMGKASRHRWPYPQLSCSSPPSDLAEDESDDFPLASELNVRKVDALYCRRCGALLTPPERPPRRILPLPSPYWRELADLWYCHTQGNTMLDRIVRQTVVATRGQWLVGVTEVVLAPQDVRANLSDSSSRAGTATEADVLTWDRASLEGDGKSPGPSPSSSSSSSASVRAVTLPLSCKPCGTVLGQVDLARKEGEAEAPLLPSEFRFYKHRITSIPLTHDLRDKLAAALAATSLTSSSASAAAAASPSSSSSSSSSSAAAAPASSGGEPEGEEGTAGDAKAVVPSLSSLGTAHLRVRTNAFSPYTIENFVSSTLLAAALAHMAFRFVIRAIPGPAGAEAKAEAGRKGAALGVKLVLLNWDTSILHAPLALPASSPPTAAPRSASNAAPEGATRRAVPVLKVLYQPVASEEDAAEWSTKHRAEEVVLAVDQVDTLINALKQSTSLLPASSRTSPLPGAAAGFSVGYLRRLTRKGTDSEQWDRTA